MEKYCSARVWASGDTDSCGDPAIVEYDGRALCKLHALEEYEHLKNECVILTESVIANLARLGLLIKRENIFALQEYVGILTRLISKVGEFLPRKELEKPAEDKEYWMKRAKEAEDKLEALNKQGIKLCFKACFYCKKEKAVIQDMCLSCAQELNSKLSQ